MADDWFVRIAATLARGQLPALLGYGFTQDQWNILNALLDNHKFDKSPKTRELAEHWRKTFLSLKKPYGGGIQ